MPYGQIQVDTVKDSLNNTLAPSSSVFRNRIINGAMVIDQRNAGASITPTVNTYTLDRWTTAISAASKFSVQQNAGSVTPPVGFSNYLGCTSLANTSLSASDFYVVQQKIEGFNFSDLNFGTANAKTITLSFWAYSSLTGTFGGSILNNNANRAYPFSYSLPTANTWTQISVTIAGDTTGTWVGATNGVGAYVNFSLGSGSSYSGTSGSWNGNFNFSATGAVSVVGTSGATFYITGVQLEVGTNATSFDYRPYGTELALCQRYCYVNGGINTYSVFGSGYAFSTTGVTSITYLPVNMRVVPTLTTTGNLRVVDGATGTAVTSVAVNTANSSYEVIVTEPNVASGLTQYRPYSFSANNDATAKIIFNSEL